MISPNLRAVLTASPRLLAVSFRKMFRRWVSTDGTARPESCASFLLVCPFAIPLKICISREVRETVVFCDNGVRSPIRRSTSGIIRLGTGLWLRATDSKAFWSSAGPASLSTYPEQPACIIRRRSSLDSDTVHAITFNPGYRARSSRAACGPSMSGMWTSIRTRSGFRAATCLKASCADAASPTNRRPAAAASRLFAAARGTTLSSTTSTRRARAVGVDLSMRAA